MLFMPSAASHTVILKGTAKVLTAGFEWLGLAQQSWLRFRTLRQTRSVGSTGLHITHDSS